LIARILYLEGMPIVSKLVAIHIGADVPLQLKYDLESEVGAVKAYNEGIRMCVELADNGTRAMLEAILSDEEVHVDWLETQMDQIKQMGLST